MGVLCEVSIYIGWNLAIASEFSLDLDPHQSDARRPASPPSRIMAP
jgi:hypothetical protein